MPPTVEPQKLSPRWLCVFELDDSAGPRRIPGKPNVKVEQKAIKPGPDLEAWLDKTKASKRPELVRVRDDLMPKDQQHGGRLEPYKYCRSSALRAERDLRLYFESKGYEVDGGTELIPKGKGLLKTK
jgi:hypothetical protein